MAGLDNISRTFNLTRDKQKRDEVQSAPSGQGVLHALEQRAQAQQQAQNQITPMMRQAMFLKDPFQAQQLQNEMRNQYHDTRLAQAQRRDVNTVASKVKDPLIAALYKVDPQRANELVNQKREAQRLQIEATAKNETELQKKLLDVTKQSDKEKQLASAGLVPGSQEYLNAVLGDNSIDLYTQKELLKNSLAINKEQAKTNLGREDKALDHQYAIDLEKAKYAIDQGLTSTGGVTIGGNGQPRLSREAREARNLEVNRFVKDFDENYATSTEVQNNADRLLNAVNLTKGTVDFTTFDKVKGVGLLNLGYDDDYTKAIEIYKQNINAISTPLAKKLGTNPTDKDLEVIQTVAGGSGSAAGIAYNALKIKADNEIRKEFNQRLSGANYDPAKRGKIKNDFTNDYDTLLKSKLKDIIDSGKFLENSPDLTSQLKRIYTGVYENAPEQSVLEPGEEPTANSTEGTSNQPSGPTSVFDDEINSLIDQYS